MNYGRPSRGQIWLIDLNPVVGHEQGETRPALVISDDQLNQGPSGLVTVLPITTTERNIPIHVKIVRGVGGLSKDSWVLCDQIRTVSIERLIKPYEPVGPNVMKEVEERVKIALGLH